MSSVDANGTSHMQCVAVCCSALRCAAVCWREWSLSHVISTSLLSCNIYSSSLCGTHSYMYLTYTHINANTITCLSHVCHVYFDTLRWGKAPIFIDIHTYDFSSNMWNKRNATRAQKIWCFSLSESLSLSPSRVSVCMSVSIYVTKYVWIFMSVRI